MIRPLRRGRDTPGQGPTLEERSRFVTDWGCAGVARRRMTRVQRTGRQASRRQTRIGALMVGRGRGARRPSCANQPPKWEICLRDACLPIALDGAEKKRPEVGLKGQAGVVSSTSAAQHHPTDIQVGSGRLTPDEGTREGETICGGPPIAKSMLTLPTATLKPAPTPGTSHENISRGDERGRTSRKPCGGGDNGF
jgi:hypothetical protein